MNLMDDIKLKMENVKKDMDNSQSITGGSTQDVISLDPNAIDNWEFRDRQDFEVGDISALAGSIKRNGQAQPIIIAHVSDIFKAKNLSDVKYVVIAGYRRWLACKNAGIKIDAIVRDLSFDQAVSCLYAENEKEPVSDYSKGMFFSNLIKENNIDKKELYNRLGFKKSTFNNYLSFSEIPTIVWDAVNDLSKITARTAAEIKWLCMKGDAYINAVIECAEKISSGIGSKKLVTLVERKLLTKSESVLDGGYKAIIDSKYNLQVKGKTLQIKTLGKSSFIPEELYLKIQDVIEEYTYK